MECNFCVSSNNRYFYLFIFVNKWHNKHKKSRQQIVVPGKSDVLLSQPGKYTIFYEYRTVVNGKRYSTDEELSGLGCTLKDKSVDQYIKIDNAASISSYHFGREGYSVFEVTVYKPGTYELSAQYDKGKDGQKVVLSIVSGKVVGMINIAMASFMITFTFLIILIIIFDRRRKAIAKMREMIDTL